MAIWLFRRKSRRKRQSIESHDTNNISHTSNMPDVASITASATGPHISSSPIRRRSDRSQRDRVLSNSRQPNKLQRRNRTYSFESGRADNLEMALNGFKGTNIKASAPTLHSQSRRRTDRGREAEIKAMSGLDKSKSKRRNDFDPLRPAVEPYASYRHGSSASKQHPDSFAARTARGEKRFMSLRSKHKGKNHSDISLPSAESIDSAMSSDSEQVAYVISPLATLAPKPTLRYASHPVRGANGAMYGPPVPYRELSHRLPRKLAKPIPEATLRAHKRVDDLANDMNASDLRELMERDMRRRERKRVSDQERAARRLSRQAERQQRMQQLERQQQQQQDHEMRDARSSPDMARGVLGREAADTPQDTTSAVVTSATRRDCTPPPPLNQRSYLPSPPPEEPEDVEMARHSESNSARSSRRRSPVEMFYRPDSSPVESVEDLPQPDVQVSANDHAAQEFAIAKADVPARTNSTLRKLAKLRKRLSNLSNSSTKSPAVSKASKTSKSSATGSVRGHNRGGVSWTSLGGILRWASRSKRSRSNSVRNVSGSSGVITGSNSVTEKAEHEMSPEELLAATAAATEAALSGPKNLTFPARAPLNPGAKPVMQRTTSRFREDLPEFLLSPSTSRVHSPVQEMEHENEGESMSEIMDVEPLPIQGAVTTFMRDAESESEQESDEESIIMPPTAFHGQYHRVQPPDESWLNVDADVGAGPHHLNRDDEHNEEDDVVADSLDPSPEPQQSLSLASIDSEGSWLSGGRAMRRRSAQPQRSLDNVSRNSYQRWTSNDHINNHSNYYGESLSALASSDVEPDHEADDDNETVNGEADTSGLTKTDANENELAHENENESATWGSVNERKVQVDSLHTASLMKSHEGLLKTFYDGEEAEASPTSPLSPVSLDSENSPVSDDFDSVQRATSVNLGRGHVRHISAGSAKLLEM